MSIFKRLKYQVGHRGAFLTFLALLDILYGYSILADPKSLSAFRMILLPQTWGILWIAVGIALLTGITTKYDKVHFGLAAALKAAWAAAWTNVWIYQDYFPRTWVAVVIWAAFAALIVVVSSWPEMRRYPPSGKDDTNG